MSPEFSKMSLALANVSTKRSRHITIRHFNLHKHCTERESIQLTSLLLAFLLDLGNDGVFVLDGLLQRPQLPVPLSQGIEHFRVRVLDSLLVQGECSKLKKTKNIF